ncbi:phosphate ABC transporter substrate-binding protein [Rhizobium rhizosphaerae]|uniref:Phosphate ABC transporter substrate-binding protein n=1 Tax=Xaviernesmea rhizosphaerae TaxID=1672749 RepID=A0A1Q9AHN0_9HYPH|nr:PhnD/SsuA/transferrin family substrate-binding protein [Xaviernesmea rhizosphaerae]OLP54744.1 phosphate ABC transporter substrate-binding protein [Xaviernesmea rhizosphaerae]
MPVASLAMYAAPEPVAAANAAWWADLRARLVATGVTALPETLDTDLGYDEAWHRPDLVLAQACGYPYVNKLQGRVRLVATPCYAYEGCYGPFSGSLIVVRRDAAFGDIGALFGSRVAINGKDSNSGMNLLRLMIAPHAIKGRFFSACLETGGHRASLAAVAGNRADIAAIDTVTFGHLRRFAPEEVANVRILARTPIGPGLPLITRGSASDAFVAALRQALRQFVDDPSTADLRETLAIRDFALLDDSHYERLRDFEREAQRLGYPEIA